MIAIQLMCATKYLVSFQGKNNQVEVKPLHQLSILALKGPTEAFRIAMGASFLQSVLPVSSHAIVTHAH